MLAAGRLKNFRLRGTKRVQAKKVHTGDANLCERHRTCVCAEAEVEGSGRVGANGRPARQRSILLIGRHLRYVAAHTQSRTPCQSRCSVSLHVVPVGYPTRSGSACLLM